MSEKVFLRHLETNITIACNNSCVACNHFVVPQRAVARHSFITPAQLELNLRHFGRVAHVGAYAMIGGEPTLHPKLPDLLQVARESGIADTLEVWTNGQTLRRMRPQFWASLDVLVVSAYPGKLGDEDLGWIREKCADAGVRFDLKDERNQPYFTRLLEAEPTDAAATADKYRRCWYRTYTRVLDHGYFYRCCTSPFIPKLLLGQPEGTDGIPVEGLTVEALRTFLDQPEPAASCTVCAGHGANPVPWAEFRRPDEWLNASAR